MPGINVAQASSLLLHSNAGDDHENEDSGQVALPGKGPSNWLSEPEPGPAAPPADADEAAVAQFLDELDADVGLTRGDVEHYCTRRFGARRDFSAARVVKHLAPHRGWQVSDGDVAVAEAPSGGSEVSGARPRGDSNVDGWCGGVGCPVCDEDDAGPPVWSREVTQRLLGRGYSPSDVGTLAFAHGASALEALRSFIDAPGEVRCEGIQGFESARKAAEVGTDVGVLPRSPGVRPQIIVTENVVVDASRAWRAVTDANSPEQFFSLGGTATWVRTDGHDDADAEPITHGRMRWLMGVTADYGRVTRQGWKACNPPHGLVTHLVAEPHPPLPRLRRLVRCPVFDHSGRLVATPGYHAETELFYAPGGLQVPPVLVCPTPREIARAKAWLEDLFGGFAFVADADRTNLVTLMLLPFVRDLIDGPTPLYVLTKPMPGSGGTLLVEAAFMAAVGKPVPMSTLPSSEQEVQRRITADLMTSPAAIVFDNIPVGTRLDSAHVASAITSTEWQDRQIRTSTLLTLPVTNTWVATGNHVKVSDEIARRSVPVRLDTHCDNPYERTGFRHPKLLAWAKQHRPELMWAALTLVQAWVAEGMPDGGLTVGKFERWAEVTSGICEVVGLPDLRANWGEWHEQRPSELPRMRKVFAAWRAVFGDKRVKAKALLPVIGEHFDLDVRDQRSASVELGKRLATWKGRVVDGCELTGREVSGSMSWRLVQRS
jgi:hypothetical protein